MFTIRRAVAVDSPAIYDVHVGAITRICAPAYTAEEGAGWVTSKKPDGYVRAIGERDFFVASTTLEDAARDRSITRLHLRSSLNAVTFYQARGYTVEGPETVRLGNGTALRCVRMHKQLG